MTYPAKDSSGTTEPYQGVEGGRRGRNGCREKAGRVGSHGRWESAGQSGTGSGRGGAQLSCCLMTPISRLHGRAAAGASRARLWSAQPPRELVPTTGALAGTLVSLFPFLLLGVNVLL